MNFIVLCLCVSLSGVLCVYLNKEEGDECEWEGLQGTCVEETRCLTTIDDDSPKHPVCYNKFGRKVICCTDCELVNSTKNAIFIPPSGLFFKNGQKTRDICLQYIYELPYECNEGGYYAGISRDLDEDNKCYRYSEWEVEGSSDDREPRAEHPYSALLGFGEDFASVTWGFGGAIISNKFILVAGRVYKHTNGDPLRFVALGVNKLSDGPTAWQIHSVEKFYPHRYYRTSDNENDIALIETKETITFNNNVLPACLHVEAAADETAISPTWKDLKLETSQDYADTIQTINLDKISEIECKQEYVYDLKGNYGINYNKQMCYGSKLRSPDVCKIESGQPLLVKTQFSSCVYTVIGITSFRKNCLLNHNGSPGVFTRVATYIPWIESVIWRPSPSCSEG